MERATRATAICLGILTTILVGWVLHVGASILQPLVIALLLASMLQPIVRGLARWRIPPVLTVVLLVGLLFWGMARVGLLVQANLGKFIGAQSTVRVERLDPISESAEGALERAPSSWVAMIDSIGRRVRDWPIFRDEGPPPLVDSWLDSMKEVKVQEVAAGLIGSGVGFTRALLLVVIYMLFIFAEQAVFRNKILYIAGQRRRDAAQVLDTIGRGIQRYLGVKTIVSFLTGALLYTVLVALDIPYALLFGCLTFALNYIPTFGSIIAGVFPTITALAVETTWHKAAVVVVAYLAVNLALGSFLEPKILGRELNLSPLVIIISVVVWAGLWGVVGTFLAVPLTAALQITLGATETTRPLAIMLSSGPPREKRRRRPPRPGKKDVAAA